MEDFFNKNCFLDSFYLDVVVLDSYVNRSFCIKYVYKVGIGVKLWFLGNDFLSIF